MRRNAGSSKRVRGWVFCGGPQPRRQRIESQYGGNVTLPERLVVMLRVATEWFCATLRVIPKDRHAAATIAILSLCACSPQGQVGSVACPPPVSYSAQDEAAIYTALQSLPPQSILNRTMDDYYHERLMLKACRP